MAKTKTLISCAVTAQLICIFVFAYADCWFSHAAAHLYKIPWVWYYNVVSSPVYLPVMWLLSLGRLFCPENNRVELCHEKKRFYIKMQ